ncbi:MAG: hypothetical protein ACMG6E_00920, partial [Candidatus Roizmanbacteria bacterium]
PPRLLSIDPGYVDTLLIPDPQEIEFDIVPVLNPKHEVEVYWESIKNSQAIQIMTIHPGKQGQPFLPDTLDKISQLRKRKYTGEILLDGGINEKSLAYILENCTYLPDTICPGSFFHKNIQENLMSLRERIDLKNSNS